MGIVRNYVSQYMHKDMLYKIHPKTDPSPPHRREEQDKNI